jgi:dCTP deaminase
MNRTFGKPGIINDKDLSDTLRTGMFVTHPDGSYLLEEAELGRPARTINDEPCLSYGISSFGYDARLGSDFKILRAPYGKNGIIDPLAIDDTVLEPFSSDVPFVMSAHSYILGYTYEKFDMPTDCVAICLGKSTYARSGVIINVTPIEPGFEGQVVVEIANVSDLPVLLRPHQGIGQFLFFCGESPFYTYASRGGKYQGQMGVTLPRK